MDNFGQKFGKWLNAFIDAKIEGNDAKAEALLDGLGGWGWPSFSEVSFPPDVDDTYPPGGNKK